MSKKNFNIIERKVSATPRKERKNSYSGQSSSSSSVVVTGGETQTVEGHTHSNKPTLDALLLNEGDNTLYIDRYNSAKETNEVVKVDAGNADNADNAEHADNADHAVKADEAEHAVKADSADEAKHAEDSDHAVNADIAEVAKYAEDSDKWDGAEFADYLNQGVRTSDDVTHKNITATESVTAKTGSIKENLTVGGVFTHDYTPGQLDGTGAAVYSKDGEGYGELDYLKVRKGLVVTKIVVAEVKSVGGIVVVSPANGTVDRVEESEDKVTIYLKEDNTFNIGDLVRWGNWDSHHNTLRAGWCRVRECDNTEQCIVFYRSDMNEYTVLPAADDALVLMGNVNDKNRQGFVIIDASDGYPHVSAYSDVNTTTLSQSMLKARFGSLENLNTEEWGLLQGYGLFSQNVYLKGDLRIRNSKTNASDLIVSSTDVYYQNDSLTVPPAKPDSTEALNGWSENMPEYVKGKFIWQCNIIERANGEVEVCEPFCISGKDGEDAIVVNIFSNQGNVLLNGQGELMLTAVVLRGKDDITDSIPSAYFSWERNSTYPEGDANWNLRHKGCGNTIVVTKEDVTVRATFDCIVSI